MHHNPRITLPNRGNEHLQQLTTVTLAQIECSWNKILISLVTKRMDGFI